MCIYIYIYIKYMQGFPYWVDGGSLPHQPKISLSPPKKQKFILSPPKVNFPH